LRLHDGPHVELSRPHFHAAALDFREVEHVVDHVEQLPARAFDVAGEPPLLVVERLDAG